MEQNLPWRSRLSYASAIASLNFISSKIGERTHRYICYLGTGYRFYSERKREVRQMFQLRMRLHVAGTSLRVALDEAEKDAKIVLFTMPGNDLGIQAPTYLISARC